MDDCINDLDRFVDRLIRGGLPLPELVDQLIETRPLPAALVADVLAPEEGGPRWTP